MHSHRSRGDSRRVGMLIALRNVLKLGNHKHSKFNANKLLRVLHIGFVANSIAAILSEVLLQKIFI